MVRPAACCDRLSYTSAAGNIVSDISAAGNIVSDKQPSQQQLPVAATPASLTRTYTDHLLEVLGKSLPDVCCSRTISFVATSGEGTSQAHTACFLQTAVDGWLSCLVIDCRLTVG
jgi:hypothetical protein